MDHLSIDFMNTDWHDWRVAGKAEDRLKNPKAVQELIEHWHLQVEHTIIPETTLTAMQTLRSQLRSMVAAIATHGQPRPEDVDVLNHWLEDWPLRASLCTTESGLHLAVDPMTAGWNGVMVQVVLSFVEMLSNGAATRLKICENEDCLWVFYDESKNRSRRWCADSCGNLLKVRRFRSRAKEQSNSPKTDT